MPAPYIWINGFPGVGKLTAARQLQRLIPRAVLIDNHSLIDVVKLPRDHPDYNAERERVREEAYRTYVYPEDDDDQMQRVVIFTDFFTSGKIGQEWSTAHKIAADKAQRPFFPVYLHCDKSENLRRVVDPSRTEQGRTKLVDVEMIQGFIEKYKIFKFETGLDIDVTGLAPEETAKKIFDWVQHGVGEAQ